MHFDQLLRVGINSLSLTEPRKHHTHAADFKYKLGKRTENSWNIIFQHQDDTRQDEILVWMFHLNKALGLLLLITKRELKAAGNNVGDIFVIEANTSTAAMLGFENWAGNTEKQSPDNYETVWSISRIHDGNFWSTLSVITEEQARLKRWLTDM